MSEPWVTFVIPVLNEAARIGVLLRDLRQRYPGCQLIVVDGGSSDGSVKAALPLCDQLLLAERGRARQMNLGGQAAAAPYVAFLHADSSPTVSLDVLRACLKSSPCWGFCHVRLDGNGRAMRIIEWCMNGRSRLTSVATGDQMLMVRNAVFRATGGFADLPLMEDVEYCKRLRRLASPVIVAAPVMTSSRRWKQGGTAATVVRMWLLRLAYWLGVSPETLSRFYYER
ncbi:TIGR04283 family arsenosugar biosynthesis glycosyltransferase [Candidatus Marimicrobium litorale]|uniref:Glycosyltransferase n=1 Tax=Candidatus Marimicrobium litorale TaxID=2518991 RepID=A0ABT3T1W0_9GAMM|nr:TIGR04283 family arsenosugar biosynthesis glycosyltransferase [Candidatus Marimicrobium litorale]MCX2976258.1 glycosyltransferase [Candidatus Marimicrobium litorale]